MKILVIGAGGQLGKDVVKIFGEEEIIPLDLPEIDISKFDSVKRVIIAYKPNLVINTAAYTNVPGCEENPKKAFEVNSIGVRNLALLSLEHSIPLLHISTDYVFDGVKGEPYIETDTSNPLNTYGISKLAGEYYITSITSKYYIVRTSGLYGVHKSITKGTNFVETMLKLLREGDEIRVITDEVLTPTYTLDLARQIKLLIEKERYGLYHITNNGECSWYQFAREIFSYLGMDVIINETTQKEFPSKVRRPLYSVLKNRMLKKQGIDIMPDWRESLHSYLDVRMFRNKV